VKAGSGAEKFKFGLTQRRKDAKENQKNICSL